MENAVEIQQPMAETTNYYNMAVKLLVERQMEPHAIKTKLIAEGASSYEAQKIVDEISNELKRAKQKAASKDIIYGSLWCVGGLVLTIANIGFIFWGAIVFGGIQLIKGIVNYATIK